MRDLRVVLVLAFCAVWAFVGCNALFAQYVNEEPARFREGSPMERIVLPKPERLALMEGEEKGGSDDPQRLKLSTLKGMVREAAPLELPVGTLPVRVELQSLSNMLDALVRDAQQGWMGGMLPKPLRGHAGGECAVAPALWVVTDSGVYRLNRASWSLGLECRGNFLKRCYLEGDSLFRSSRLLVLGEPERAGAFLSESSPEGRASVVRSGGVEAFSHTLGEEQGAQPGEFSSEGAPSFARGEKRILGGFVAYAWREGRKDNGVLRAHRGSPMTKDGGKRELLENYGRKIDR